MEFAKLPEHIAFIMDGNGRWATGRKLARLRGHREGIESVQRMVEEGLRLGVKTMTFYAFSTENWKRPDEEVSGLFSLMREYFKLKLNELNEKNVRVQFMGNRMAAGQGGGEQQLSDDILDLMNTVEAKTEHNDGITVRFAINYSGRDEILRAIGFYAEDIRDEKTNPWELTEEGFEKYLDFGGMPAPDLMIRTSGEQRLSNFMLWQMAYAEFMFHPKHWPDFQVKDLHDCLSQYVKRDRRFGGLNTPTLSFSEDLADGVVEE